MASIYRLVSLEGGELEWVDLVGSAGVVAATGRSCASWARHTLRVYNEELVQRRHARDEADLILLHIPASSSDEAYHFDLESPVFVPSGTDLVELFAGWPGRPKPPPRWVSRG